MSEQRFTIQKASGMYFHLPIFKDGVEMADDDVCILLNEQQATITELQSDLKECRARKEIIREKLKKYQDIANEYDCVSSVKLAEKIDEQQSTITALKEENEKLRQRNRKLYKCALYGKTIGDEI